MKFNTRKEMLDYCNEEGCYIDPSYYDLTNMADCAEYIKDSNENYSDKFMYQWPRTAHDYYDEDFYISYHYKAVGLEMFKKEEFWKHLIKIPLSPCYLENADFMTYEDMLKILYTFKEPDTANYLGTFLRDRTDWDDWEFGNSYRSDGKRCLNYEEMDEYSKKQDKEITDFLKSLNKQKI